MTIAQTQTLTRSEARQLIESLRQHDLDAGRSGTWAIHALCVGDTASRIAEAMGLDVDFAAVLGYLHDIGRGLGPAEQHILTGYQYLRDYGYLDDYCNICLTHSFLDQTPEFLSGDRLDDPFLTAFLRSHQRTIYEKIVTLCDLLCTDHLCRLEERLIDILLRYGASERTQLHLRQVFQLKTELESHIGRSIEAVLQEKTDS